MSKQIDLHVLEFYQTKKLLGSGAYGHVWKVIDKRTKSVLALKKIFDAFQNSTDAQRTYRQISLLHEMSHKNIIKLFKVIKAKNKRDLYLVFEYMQSDLHSLVGQEILTPQHIKFVIYQILKALKYLHSAQLIHRDLKPSNVLINSDCQIKLCDFGLARSLVHQQHQQNILSQEVATRWYRSPEILLSSQDYSKPTDVWSVGCILAELIIGQPIFQGNSTLNQLQKIIQFTGIPSKYTIDSLKSDLADSVINNLTVRKKSIKDYFHDKFHNNSSELTELINLTIKMLDFNPSKRPTVEQLLSNIIFKEFQESINSYEEQQVCQKFIVPQIDDNIKLTMQQYRKIIYKDIQRRYPQFNDDTKIKRMYATPSNVGQKKHKSLMQKNKNKSQEKHHYSVYKDNNVSMNNGSKLLQKNVESPSKAQVIKKSIKREIATKNGASESIHVSINNVDYLKAKFLKTDNKNSTVLKQQHQLKQIFCQAKQIKQPVKPNHFFNEQNSTKNNQNNYQNNENQEKKFVRSIQKVKKTKKEQNLKKSIKKQSLQKQNIQTQKDYPIFRQQQKASIYKEELKRMKSSKNVLLKTSKLVKPKFDRPKLK